MKEKTLEEIVREASNTVWNSGTDLTHNQLDEIISTAIKQSNIALLKKVASTIEGQRIHLNTVEETSEFARGYNYGTERANGFFKKTLLKLDEIRKSL